MCTNEKPTEEPLWLTRDGKTIPYSEVTHQHWSNIYWYHRYIIETQSECDFLISKKFDEQRESLIARCQRIQNLAEQQIRIRFGGVILDWVPVYENEKEWYMLQNTRKILFEKYKGV